jgi:predicted short-subunit dehydrogenase-like oxidoreductase (DUF2520 family)
MDQHTFGATVRPERCAVVGRGRIGSALVAAEPAFAGPFGRGYDGGDHDVVILAVPDREIANAAAAVVPHAGRFVGHCSGATGLDVLAPHAAFGMHPLMTVVPGDDGDGVRTSPFIDAPAAIGGTTPDASAIAAALARHLGMAPFPITDRDRAAYHAAASIASNFLVTIEDAAERMLRSCGLERHILLPLVRATVDNWERQGSASLTGPVARGDEPTIARQRAAVAERQPELLDLFDALVARTRHIA